MKNNEIQKVIEKIQKVTYHVGTFEGSFPKILKDAPIYTRSHLIVLFEVLPFLKHLLKFSSETVPIVGKMLGVAQEGTSDLEQASEHLKTINQSSEMAVTEIFSALDQVGALLRKAQEQGAGEDLKTTLGEANMQLMAIMNALQFQDITAQKIEATNALLARLGDGLLSLVRQLGVTAADHSIKARKGTFDEKAAFDREMADEKQGDIDQLIEGNVATKQEAPPDPIDSVVDSAQEAKKEDTESETVAQDDIDALVDSETGETEAVAQNDIDALVDSTSANGNPPEVASSETVAQDDIDALIDAETETVAQDDIDALVDSTQEDPKEEAEAASETVAQDDIDALLDSTQEDNL